MTDKPECEYCKQLEATLLEKIQQLAKVVARNDRLRDERDHALNCIESCNDAINNAHVQDDADNQRAQLGYIQDRLTNP